MRVSAGSPHPESGQAAIFGVLVLLMFAAYGVVMVMNLAEERSSVVYGLRAREAVYAAETGIEYAIEEIRADVKKGGNISGLKVGGTTVDVSNSGDTLLTAVASTSDPSIERTIDLSIEVSTLPAAFYYALYVSRQPVLWMWSRSTIEGNMLFDGRFLLLGRRTRFSKGYMFVPRTARVVDFGRRTVARHDYMYIDEPPDDFPILRSDYYDRFINNVNGYESVDPVINKKTKLKDFKDRVIYRDGNLTIKADVKGPGTICASGGITVQNKARVGPDVSIIAGEDIRISDSRVTSGKTIGSLLYARRDIIVDNGADLSSVVLARANFSTNNKVKLKGISFVEGTSRLQGNYDIKGSFVTSRMQRLRGRGKIVFSEKVLEGISIPGVEGRPRVKRNDWRAG